MIWTGNGRVASQGWSPGTCPASVYSPPDSSNTDFDNQQRGSGQALLREILVPGYQGIRLDFVVLVPAYGERRDKHPHADRAGLI
jgi:hypothetical protein